MNNDIYFPVSSQPIKTSINGIMTVSHDHQAIVREDTGKVLGVHSAKYKLVRNEDVFPHISDALDRTDIDLRDMTVFDQVDFSGARTIRTYNFPHHSIDIGGGDKVCLQVKATNSYDGSNAFGFLFGGYRFICSNGMVVGTSLARAKRKHTTNINVEEMINKLNIAANSYFENEPMWKKWASTHITDEQALAVLLELAGGNEDGRLYKQLIPMWWKERSALGATAWALYQVVTAWSTHTTSRTRENAGTALLLREDRVRNILPSIEKLAA